MEKAKKQKQVMIAGFSQKKNKNKSGKQQESLNNIAWRFRPAK